MVTSRIRLSILVSIFLLLAPVVHATTIGSVSGSTATLTAGKMDGVQVGMTALVRGITNIEGKATEVTIAMVRVTAVNDRSCTASIVEQSADATMPKISAGQKVVFKQALVPPSGKPSAEPPPSPSKAPYSGLSPLELSAKADAAYSAGRFDEAEKYYSAVLRAVPEDPLSSQRLKELSGRKQQAEAEARRRAETMEKLQNADFFLTRGDDAYRAGDYALAASYYTKVAEVDETYRGAGGKYWLSKAWAAKTKGDTAALREARGKLKGMTVPESLKGDMAGLGPDAALASPPMPARSVAPSANEAAVLETRLGKIVIQFFPDKAPNHVRNFKNLCKSGFYNGTRFHRVVPGFMVQGGDPNTKKGDKLAWGKGGHEVNGKEVTVKAEFNDIHHARGIVSMARAQDPNSASSQFFICVTDAGFLDGKYTVFGEVIEGMDVVEKIVSATKDPQGQDNPEGSRPANPVAIDKATLEPLPAL